MKIKQSMKNWWRVSINIDKPFKNKNDKIKEVWANKSLKKNNSKSNHQDFRCPNIWEKSFYNYKKSNKIIKMILCFKSEKNKFN